MSLHVVPPAWILPVSLPEKSVFDYISTSTYYITSNGSHILSTYGGWYSVWVQSINPTSIFLDQRNTSGVSYIILQCVGDERGLFWKILFVQHSHCMMPWCCTGAGIVRASGSGLATP